MQIRQDIQAAWDGFVENGSESAYFMLYRHYHHYFIYIAVQKGVSVERAKDAINDLFLYVFENRALLSKIRSFNNYLVTSFLNNLFKKDAFSVEEPLTGREELIADEPILPAAGYYEPGGSPGGVIRSLQKYLDKLNPNQANMIYQKFFLGLSYQEIASAKGVSVKTVYNTILRAVVRLNDLIGEEGARSLKAAVFSLGSFLFAEAGLLLGVFVSLFH